MKKIFDLIRIGYRSIFMRMLIIYLAATIPVYIFGAMICREGGQRLIDEVLLTKRAQMTHYLTSLENDIQSLVIAQSNCASGVYSNVIANRYHTLPPYEWSRYINDHRKELQLLKGSSRYADSATTYYPRLGRMIDEHDGLGEISEEGFALQKSMRERTNFFVYDHSLYTIASAVHKPELGYNVIVRLSLHQMQEDLLQFKGGVPSDSFLIYLPDALALASNATEAQMDPLALLPGDIMGGSHSAEYREIDGEQYALVYAYAPYLKTVLITAIHAEDLSLVARVYWDRLWVLAISATIVIVLFAVLIIRQMHRPIRKLTHAFELLQKGDLSVEIRDRRRDEFHYLYEGFNLMVRNLHAHIDQAYAQKMLRQRAELLQLQAQINPHFLYNSYFMLHRMIKRHDMDSAAQFSRYIGEYFQYITRNAAQIVPLSSEINHARLYAQIQAARFEGRIEVSFDDLPDEFENAQVPRLILQPILENAFEHGLKEKVENGHVCVRFWVEGELLTIIVEDNGDDLDDLKLSELIAQLSDENAPTEMTAIYNIERRLRFSYPSGGMRISRSELGGIRIELYGISMEARSE